MLYRNQIFTGVFAALLASSTTAQAFEDAKYPDLTGQWVAVRMPGVTGQPAFDPTKPWGRGQQAPLTPEYQKVLEASIADPAIGRRLSSRVSWVIRSATGSTRRATADSQRWRSRPGT